MKRVDAAALWDVLAHHNGRRKAFFFFGKKYTRWDVSADCEDLGYPKDISKGWDGIWRDGFDAVVVWPRHVKDSDRNDQLRRKAYFFKGGSYIRWDIKDDKADGGEQPIVDGWNNWPEGWTKVDAAVAYNDKRVFFFSGKQYAHFEIDKDQFTWVRSIEDHWDGLPASGIDAATNWPGARALSWIPSIYPGPSPVASNPWTDFSKVYFFFGSQYCRYDIDKDELDKGYPHQIEWWWPSRSFGVFVALDVPSDPDEDARLHDAKGNVDNGYRYPDGPRRGQPGWDLGLKLDRIDQLPAELAGREFPKWLGGGKIEHGSVTRLAICAHGAPGQVAVYGLGGAEKLTPRTLQATSSKVKDDLLAIEPWLAKDATVLFMSCRVGGSGDGTLLLELLSKLLPGRSIVGFWTTGYIIAGQMGRSGWSGTNEAGMRDTDGQTDAISPSTAAGKKFNDEVEAKWDDLNALPWASEESKHARVAKDGKMILDTWVAAGGGGPPTPDP